MARLTASHDSGHAATPLVGDTIGATLAAVVDAQPDRLALVSRHQGIRWTWAELDDEVEKVALGLLALGIEAGDRVGIWSPNCAEWTVLQFACARVGAILVNVNPAYRPAELAYALRHSGVRLLVTAESFKTSDYLVMLDVGTRRAAVARARGHDRYRHAPAGPTTCCGTSSSAVAVQADADTLREREASLHCDDPINIQYTSGTTGNPKGATLTHHNILNNARSVVDDSRVHARRPGVHPGAALPLLRDGDRQPRMPRGRGDDGVSGALVRSDRDARGDRRGALHEHLRRADDVHRPARAPAVRRLRPHVVAHRDHGGRAVPDRGHEARRTPTCTRRRSASPTA